MSEVKYMHCIERFPSMKKTGHIIMKKRGNEADVIWSNDVYTYIIAGYHINNFKFVFENSSYNTLREIKKEDIDAIKENYWLYEI